LKVRREVAASMLPNRKSSNDLTMLKRSYRLALLYRALFSIQSLLLFILRNSWPLRGCRLPNAPTRFPDELNDGATSDTASQSLAATGAGFMGGKIIDRTSMCYRPATSAVWVSVVSMFPWARLCNRSVSLFIHC
jgi:hypothetical protein